MLCLVDAEKDAFSPAAKRLVQLVSCYVCLDLLCNMLKVGCNMSSV
jgi:hypothetical protein